jgi:hypothetical protein
MVGLVIAIVQTRYPSQLDAISMNERQITRFSSIDRMPEI